MDPDLHLPFYEAVTQSHSAQGFAAAPPGTLPVPPSELPGVLPSLLDRLLELLPGTFLFIEVEFVDGVNRVGVGVVVAAGDGVTGDESAGVGVVEAGAH